MRIMFMGTPEIASTCLDQLVSVGHDVVACVTGEDKPRGRGKVMTPTAVKARAKELGIPKETAVLLEHMLISHHGQPEFGAAVRPMFIEAEVLSQLDTLDATMYEMAQAISAVEVGGFTQRMWALDNRKLYNHGRKVPETKVNLD